MNLVLCTEDQHPSSNNADIHINNIDIYTEHHSAEHNSETASDLNMSDSGREVDTRSPAVGYRMEIYWPLEHKFFAGNFNSIDDDEKKNVI